MIFKIKKVIWIIIFPVIFSNIFAVKTDVIIDSDMTFEQAVEGTKAPKEVLESLVLLDVQYFSFDKKLHKGQLVVHKSVQQDVKEVFNLILELKFPVNKVVPIVKYEWSDDESMADNNTSAFCYRYVSGTKRFSNHAFGKAVDINPFYNPVIYADGKTSPKGAKYQPKKDGTFSQEHQIVKKFIELGWRWGGNFQSFKDYHHFDKLD
jgi:hypothetical protein